LSLSKNVYSSLISFITALVLALGANVSPAAAAETATTINGVTYTIEGAGAAYASAYNAALPATVSIESSVTIGGASYSVTKIGNSAFNGATWVTSVTIPNSVTSIGTYAFAYTSAMTSVTLSNSLTRIGDYAFHGAAALTSVTIPDSVTTIGAYAFAYNSALASVTLSNSLTTLSDYAFLNATSLVSVTIPDSVTSVGAYAFAYNFALVSVTIGNSVTRVNNYAFWQAQALTSMAFRGAAPTVGTDAFGGENPTVYYFPRFGSGVVTGGFSSPTWKGLTTVSIPPMTLKPTPSITGTVTEGQTLTANPGTWDSGVSLVYQWRRNGIAIAGATSATYALASADSGAFMTVTVTASKASYETASMTSSATAAVVATTTTINGVIYTMDGAGAAYVSGKTGDLPTTVSIAASVTIGGKSYAVTSIGGEAFYMASKLASITIPNSVTSLGDRAFNKANALTSVTFKGAAPNVGTSVFIGESPTVYFYSRLGSNLVAGGFTSPIWQGLTSVGVDEPLTLTPTPTIAGTAAVGQALTANPGTWDTAVSFAYRWLRNGVAVPGATTAKYVLTADDLLKTISVEVTGSKATFVTTTKTSVSSEAVALGTQVLSPNPTITGLAQVGQTLTAKPGTWDAGVQLKYLWFRNGIEIDAPSSPTYSLTAADFDSTITVTVTGSKPGYLDDFGNSRSTLRVTVASLTLAPIPTITGKTVVGKPLTAVAGTWDSGVALSYVWKRNGVVVAGETSSTYVLSAIDLAATISVAVTGTKNGFLSVTNTSLATSIVGPGTLRLTPVPTIKGTTTVGMVLTAKPWDWDSGVTLTYAWFASGVAIKKATDDTYKLVNADASKKITVSVTGTKPGYTTVTMTSLATGKVKP